VERGGRNVMQRRREGGGRRRGERGGGEWRRLIGNKEIWRGLVGCVDGGEEDRG